jgi:hypothetical protein
MYILQYYHKQTSAFFDDTSQFVFTCVDNVNNKVYFKLQLREKIFLFSTHDKQPDNQQH